MLDNIKDKVRSWIPSKWQVEETERKKKSRIKKGTWLKKRQRLAKEQLAKKPKEKKKRRPLSEEHKQKMRGILGKARQVRSENLKKIRETKNVETEKLAKITKDPLDNNKDLRQQIADWMGL